MHAKEKRKEGESGPPTKYIILTKKIKIKTYIYIYIYIYIYAWHGSEYRYLGMWHFVKNSQHEHSRQKAESGLLFNKPISFDAKIPSIVCGIRRPSRTRLTFYPLCAATSSNYEFFSYKSLKKTKFFLF